MGIVRTSVSALALALAMAATASAQSLEEKLQAELKEPFLQNAPWVLDYAEAVQKAKAEKKIIFAYFTRTYAPWPFCKQVEGGAFSTPEFKEFTKQVVPYINITTHIEGRKDEDLFQKKGGRGFPYIVFLDEDGGLIAKQPGNARTVEGFQKTLDEDVKQFLDLEAKAKAGDEAAQIELTLREGDLGRITFDEVQKLLAGKKLTEDQNTMLVDLELSGLVDALSNVKSEDEARAAAKKVADSFLAGRIPNAAEKKQRFVQIAFSYGMREEVPDLAQKAFEALKSIYEEQHGKDNPQLQKWEEQISSKIAEMRAAKEEKGSEEEEGTEEGCGEESGEDK